MRAVSKVYLKGRIQDRKRGRRRPDGTNMAVAGRMGEAAAWFPRAASQAQANNGDLNGCGISCNSASVKIGPHAVCVDAFAMPCHPAPVDRQRTIRWLCCQEARAAQRQGPVLPSC